MRYRNAAKSGWSQSTFLPARVNLVAHNYTWLIHVLIDDCTSPPARVPSVRYMIV